MFSYSRNAQVTCAKATTEKISFHNFVIIAWSDKAVKGTALNWALPSLHGGSIKISRTVPLILNLSSIKWQELYINIWHNLIHHLICLKTRFLQQFYYFHCLLKLENGTNNIMWSIWNGLTQKGQYIWSRCFQFVYQNLMKYKNPPTLLWYKK